MIVEYTAPKTQDWTMKEIPPFKLIPQPMTEESAKLPKFKWAADEIGTRHKLGGVPDFIQKSQWPSCPDCRSVMTFYSQIDSINDEFCLADCGLIYTFVCFDCVNVQSFVQSY